MVEMARNLIAKASRANTIVSEKIHNVMIVKLGKDAVEKAPIFWYAS